VYSRDMGRGNSREGFHLLLLTTEGVYSRDMGRGNSREEGGGDRGGRALLRPAPILEARHLRLDDRDLRRAARDRFLRSKVIVTHDRFLRSKVIVTQVQLSHGAGHVGTIMRATTTHV